MRVRELLAANAFCLLALGLACCKRVEQPVGVYNQHERPARLNTEPAHPAGSTAEPEAGSTATPPEDAAAPWTAFDASMPIAEDAGPPTGPSTWLPPMLLDAGPSGSPNRPNCNVREATPRRLDMYLMVDSNVTVSATPVWEVMTDGISRFVVDPRSTGTGVGIRYFGNTCDSAEYAQPSVAVDVLPKNASAIILSTRARRWSASPMLPALEGAIQYQRARARLHPEAKQAVVLVSDGFTQDFTCQYSTQSLAEAARDGVVELPSVETHVVAVGVNTNVSQPLDSLIQWLGSFNAIAAAGGSGTAVTTDITGDAASFSEALQRVRRNAMPCEFEAPAGAMLGEFGVARFPNPAEELPLVANERSCGNGQGWYYASESAPTPVTLCKATCDWLRESDEHAIGLLLDCER
jgi:hypothetical protein